MSKFCKIIIILLALLSTETVRAQYCNIYSTGMEPGNDYLWITPGVAGTYKCAPGWVLTGFSYDGRNDDHINGRHCRQLKNVP